MTIQELARQASESLIWNERKEGGKYCYFKDGSPQWMKEMAFKCHNIDDVMPNDYIYAFISEALDIITGSDNPDEAIFEIEPDIYNNELLSWLSSNLSFSSWVDEEIEECGSKELFGLLQHAQARHKQAIASCVLSELQAELDSNIER